MGVRLDFFLQGKDFFGGKGKHPVLFPITKRNRPAHISVLSDAGLPLLPRGPKSRGSLRRAGLSGCPRGAGVVTVPPLPWLCCAGRASRRDQELCSPARPGREQATSCSEVGIEVGFHPV